MKAFFFDLDGTLMMSDKLHVRVFQEMMEERGLTFGEKDFREIVRGKSNAEFFPILFPAEDAQRLAEEKEERFRQMVVTDAEIIPGLLPFLKEAQNRGITMMVVTNAFRENAEHMLKSIGVWSFLSGLVAGGEAGKYKPFSDPYVLALEKLGISSEDAIAFEDSPGGLKASCGAGIASIGIASSKPENVLLAAGASLVVTSYNDSESFFEFSQKLFKV